MPYRRRPPLTEEQKERAQIQLQRMKETEELLNINKLVGERQRKLSPFIERVKGWKDNKDSYWDIFDKWRLVVPLGQSQILNVPKGGVTIRYKDKGNWIEKHFDSGTIDVGNSINAPVEVLLDDTKDTSDGWIPLMGEQRNYFHNNEGLIIPVSRIVRFGIPGNWIEKKMTDDQPILDTKEFFEGDPAPGFPKYVWVKKIPSDDVSEYDEEMTRMKSEDMYQSGQGKKTRRNRKLKKRKTTRKH
jgi:hypothetical protein